MVIIANTQRAQLSVNRIEGAFSRRSEKLGVHIYAQREDLFNAMHRI